MKKNSKGFFLAETIIVLALVTTAIAFVLPNVTKVHENYKNVSMYYDHPKDIYSLKTISGLENVTHEKWVSAIKKENIELRDSFSKAVENAIGSWCNTNITDLREIKDSFDNTTLKLLHLKKLYITGYMSTPPASDYEFKKYLNRLKKTSYDNTSYRLIGIFDIKDINGNTIGTRYASIKIPNDKIDMCP